MAWELSPHSSCRKVQWKNVFKPSAHFHSLAAPTNHFHPASLSLLVSLLIAFSWCSPGVKPESRGDILLSFVGMHWFWYTLVGQELHTHTQIYFYIYLTFTQHKLLTSAKICICGVVWECNNFIHSILQGDAAHTQSTKICTSADLKALLFVTFGQDQVLCLWTEHNCLKELCFISHCVWVTSASSGEHT